MSDDPEAEKNAFLDKLQQSLEEHSFIKLSLGKPVDAKDTKKCVVTLVELKEKLHCQFVYTNMTNTVTKNLKMHEAKDKVAYLLQHKFLSGALFSTELDMQYIVNKKGKARLVKAKPTQSLQTSLEHDRKKSYFIDEHSAYLHHLGVTTGGGEIKPKMYSKFRQIAKFIEIIQTAMTSIEMKDDQSVNVLDIGSGKGYLTFALYDYLSKNFKALPAITGVDRKQDMVQLCNDIVTRVGFEGLSFKHEQVEDHDASKIDVLIALHACNTATDEAIAQGIAADSKLIICAPCCQHEIAPQLSLEKSALEPLAQHGLFKQRQADLVTDIARTLLLEAAGYNVKVIEFISSEHTAKNVMIVGSKSDKVDRDQALKKYHGLKDIFGFKSHKLETLLYKN